MPTRFSIDRFVRSIGGVLKRRWISLSFLTLMIVVLPALAVFWWQRPDVSTVLIPSTPVRLLLSLIPYVTGTVLMTATAHVTVIDRANSTTGLLATLIATARRTPVALAVTLAAAGPLIAAQWSASLALPFAGEALGVVALGWLLLVATYCAPAMGVVLAERRGWRMPARILTLSRRRRLILFLLVLLVASAAVILVVESGRLSKALLPSMLFRAEDVGQSLAMAISYAMAGVVSAALFLELRRLVDSPDPNEAAAVFD